MEISGGKDIFGSWKASVSEAISPDAGKLSAMLSEEIAGERRASDRRAGLPGIARGAAVSGGS